MYYAGEKIRVYYIGKATGLTVKFNFWDPDGNKIVSDADGTELGSKIYYYDFTPTKIGDYVGYADCSAKPRRMNFNLHVVKAIKTTSGFMYSPEIDTERILEIIDKRFTKLEKQLRKVIEKKSFDVENSKLPQIESKFEHKLEQQIDNLKKELQERDNTLLRALSTEALIKLAKDEDVSDSG